MVSDDSSRRGKEPDAAHGSSTQDSSITRVNPFAQNTLVGTRLADRYEIISVIGHGGMGVVYKARHELIDRVVAIKMLKPQLIMDAASAQRFQQEAKAASRLSHPNVITLFDFGLTPTGQPYLVMDFLQGSSLSELIKRERQLSVDRFVSICSQVCDALDHAHRNGIIHRDLKPGNIMLTTRQGEADLVKVVDFGVAKIMPFAGEDSQSVTQSGEVFGSPVYMSPEQCVGEPLDVRSDIYSMGVVMYEMLTGTVPLRGKDIIQTIMMHKCDLPSPFAQMRPDLHIPDRLEAAVFKALAKDPAKRYQSMSEIKESLLDGGVNVAGATTSRAPVRTTEVQARTGPNLIPLLVGAVISLAVALIGAAVWLATKKPAPAAETKAPITSPITPAPTGGGTRVGSATSTKPGQTSALPQKSSRQDVQPSPPKSAQTPSSVTTPPAVQVTKPRQAATATVKSSKRQPRRVGNAGADEPGLAEPSPKRHSEPDQMGTWYRFSETERGN